jgi:hypothetical protein
MIIWVKGGERERERISVDENALISSQLQMDTRLFYFLFAYNYV